jgi:hypothetical protein
MHVVSIGVNTGSNCPLFVRVPIARLPPGTSMPRVKEQILAIGIGRGWRLIKINERRSSTRLDVARDGGSTHRIVPGTVWESLRFVGETLDAESVHRETP